ncbi:MAG: phosphate acetyltransferase [Firmicutes bacterium]|nr:phosphate acetyltransferase [Bacillota bacterium]
MSLMEHIKNKARADKKTIVLAEGHDRRTVAAAAIVRNEGIADIVILGDRAQIESFGEDLTGIRIVEPAKSEWLEDFAQTYYELRKAKGMTPEKAMEIMKSDVLVFGAMMVKKDKVDGMVAGAVNSTSNVIRAAVTVIKMAPGIKYASSCFIMESPYPEFGDNGKMVYGDCGFVIDPDVDQLSDIAIATAKTAKDVVDIDPKVAMLSFSTKGSARHPCVDKVIQATELVKQKAPDLPVDGELQLDAALVPSVGEFKSPGSPVAGHANVLIFPNLDAGNIGYKLTQRLGKAWALGPILQGLAKPVNDLSRGCTAEDIAGVVAVTCVQAQNVGK